MEDSRREESGSDARHEGRTVKAAREEDPLSDQETNQPREDEDVELHRRKSSQMAAGEEPKAEGETDDDVELHARRGGSSEKL